MSDSIDKEQPFIAHLIELRDRLLRIVLVVVAILVILLPFANKLFVFIATPLMEKLPGDMIAIGTIAPFFTPLKLSLLSSLFISVPFILYQFWAFIAPGLYQHERKMVMPLVISSTLLFYLGTAFAFYIVFPLVFEFIVSTAPEGVSVQTDIADYLDFVLTLFFAFGVAFEIPVATIILLWTGVTTRESLAKGRPYIIVGAFIVGMLLTPPDVISQVLLALPMWVLFEAGLIASRFFIKPKDEDAEADEEIDTAEAATATAGAHGASVAYPDDYVEPTDEEMEAELDSLDDDDEEKDKEQPAAETTSEDPADAKEDAEAYESRYRDEYDEDEEGYYDEEDEDSPENEGRDEGDAVMDDLVASKLLRIMHHRIAGEEAEARALLYEVLAEGNEDQKNVAKEILHQLDN